MQGVSLVLIVILKHRPVIVSLPYTAVIPLWGVAFSEDRIEVQFCNLSPLSEPVLLVCPLFASSGLSRRVKFLKMCFLIGKQLHEKSGAVIS